MIQDVGYCVASCLQNGDGTRVAIRLSRKTMIDLTAHAEENARSTPWIERRVMAWHQWRDRRIYRVRRWLPSNTAKGRIDGHKIQDD